MKKTLFLIAALLLLSCNSLTWRYDYSDLHKIETSEWIEYNDQQRDSIRDLVEGLYITMEEPDNSTQAEIDSLESALMYYTER